MKRLLAYLLILSSVNSFGQSDTIYYESFGQGIPNDWQLDDSLNGNYHWLHTTTGIEGAFNPASFTEMNSTSSQDGWLLFPAFYYNTDTTGGQLNPILPGTYFNSKIISASYDFTGESSVFLSFEHWYHTLSAPTWGDFNISISTDSINWTKFNALTGPDSPATGSQIRIEQLVFDISPIAANQNNLWVRFHANNLAWHFWMVDDLLFTKSNPINTAQLDTISSSPKELISVTDLLGRPVNREGGQLVLFRYNDGSIEKKYIVK